jgi:hypothetical protein
MSRDSISEPVLILSKIAFMPKSGGCEPQVQGKVFVDTGIVGICNVFYNSTVVLKLDTGIAWVFRATAGSKAISGSRNPGSAAGRGRGLD